MYRVQGTPWYMPAVFVVLQSSPIAPENDLVPPGSYRWHRFAVLVMSGLSRGLSSCRIKKNMSTGTGYQNHKRHLLILLLLLLLLLLLYFANTNIVYLAKSLESNRKPKIPIESPLHLIVAYGAVINSILPHLSDIKSMSYTY